MLRHEKWERDRPATDKANCSEPKAKSPGRPKWASKQGVMARFPKSNRVGQSAPQPQRSVDFSLAFGQSGYDNLPSIFHD
jgi:hypothetical protein